LTCRFSLYEPVSFTTLFLTPVLNFQKKGGHVALHVPCTSKQVAGLAEKFVELAEMCVEKATPTGVKGTTAPATDWNCGTSLAYCNALLVHSVAASLGQCLGARACRSAPA
jgi:hypothetical protein